MPHPAPLPPQYGTYPSAPCPQWHAQSIHPHIRHLPKQEGTRSLFLLNKPGDGTELRNSYAVTHNYLDLRNTVTHNYSGLHNIS